MYIWLKFIAFILSAIAAMNSQIAEVKKPEPVKQEHVQEIVQINEPEVPKETKVVKEEVEPEEVTIKVTQPPTRYYDHVYVNDIDVQIVEVDPYDTYQLQAIVDDPYKGVSYQYYHCTYIGDHSHECFATLPSVQIGDLMYWHGKTYQCYYADDNAYLDGMRNIVLSNGQYLYDQECVALVTCKTDFSRYVRLFKEV